MYRFIESICLYDGEFRNIELHEQRMIRALASVGVQKKINLSNLLQNEKIPKSGWWKCRVTYDINKENISFNEYQARTVSSLKIVYDNTIDYSHKYVDRKNLDDLFSLKGECDDIIIVKNRMVTDSYYGNLAFRKNGKWFTPESYLLPGIMREKLLKDQTLQLADITAANIHTFEGVKIINALLGFNGPEIDIKNVIDTR